MNTLIVGKDATGVTRPVLVDADGKLILAAEFTGTVTVGAVSIDHTTPGTTDAVVVSSSALPTGAATDAKLDAIVAKMLAAPATGAKQDTGNSALSTINGKITACDTGAVVVASSALPTGAASETTLAGLDAKVTACDTGAVVVASGAITATPPATAVAATTAYANSLVVKAAAGTLYSLTGYNSGPAQWLQLHNSATVPANGAAPLLTVSIPAQSSFQFEWARGLACSTGISLSNSSTGATKTIGSADTYITATYI